MSGSPQRETPHLGIFWVVQTTDSEARLLAAGCPLEQAEPYGDCLTYGPGHYETWAQWLREFQDCPEFDFEPCFYRTRSFESRGDGLFDNNTEYGT
jgi:hypothetical protein